MQRLTYGFAGMVLAAAVIGGCQVSPTGLAEDKQVEIRSVAEEFTNAIRAGDAERLKHVSTVKNENEKLANVAVKDTVTSRKVLNSLSEHFGYVEPKPTVIASNQWIDRLASTASMGQIYREGDRVLLKGQDQGEIYLKKVAGEWKVDLIPTLVPESGGNETVKDPIVEYRFGVTQQLNAWMLSRLENNEFQSKNDFDKARSKFWMEYLTYAASGKDPQTAVLPTLPEMPHEDKGTFVREE